MATASQFVSLLTTSNLDIRVPLTPIISPSGISEILTANSRRTLFFGMPHISWWLMSIDENVSLFVMLKLLVGATDTDQLDAFLKEIILTVEVAVTESPWQSDLGAKREKFEGSVVYSTTIPDALEGIKEQIEEQWFVAWNVNVPISLPHTIAFTNYQDMVERKFQALVLHSQQYYFYLLPH
jgi:hypothetical protein